MPYDPSKNIRVKQQITTRTSTVGSEWMIKKPSDFDFFTVYGERVEDLDLVYTYTQRIGNGDVKSFIIQPESDEELEKIIGLLGESSVGSAIVCPYYLNGNGKNGIWLAKQPKIGTGRVHDVHTQIRTQIIPAAQEGYIKLEWDSDDMKYKIKKPENLQAFRDPKWDKEELTKQVAKAFNEILIENSTHEIIKRAIGEIR